jgi:hypothetical protein
MFDLFKKKKRLDNQKIIIETVIRAINSNQNGIRDAIKSVIEQ